MLLLLFLAVNIAASCFLLLLLVSMLMSTLLLLPALLLLLLLVLLLLCSVVAAVGAAADEDSSRQTPNPANLGGRTRSQRPRPTPWWMEQGWRPQQRGVLGGIAKTTKPLFLLHQIANFGLECDQQNRIPIVEQRKTVRIHRGFVLNLEIDALRCRQTMPTRWI